jgi:transcriptional regulator with XRE-family HTH domain
MESQKAPGVVAERVRSLRRALGLTQARLTKHGGFAPAEVSRIEIGRNKAGSGRVRQKLAKGFGLSLEDTFAFVEGRLSVADAAQRACPPKEAP